MPFSYLKNKSRCKLLYCYVWNTYDIMPPWVHSLS